jgi:hypothetical protein
MLNRILYWFITLPGLLKGGCLGVIGVLTACSCMFVASIPAATARVEAQATQTSVAVVQQSPQTVRDTTATSQANAEATTQEAFDAATATTETYLVATQTAVAAPTATTKANEAATTTALAMQTATVEALAAATSTAVAVETAYAVQTAESIAAAEQATATAEAHIQATATAAQQATAAAETQAQATATIEDYRNQMPKGWWMGQENGVGVVVGDFRYAREAGYFSADPGTRFVAFGIAVYNESGSEIHVNPLYVSLVDLDGSTYAPNLMGSSSYWSQPLHGVDVLDGNRADGGMLFVIPQDSAPAQVVYDTNRLFGGTIVIDLRRPPDEQP